MNSAEAGIVRRRDGARTYGYEIGVIALDFDSPFIPGDVGHAATFGVPTVYERVPGLSVPAILDDSADTFLPEVLTAARTLADEGIDILTSNCGFMIRYQRAVARELSGVQVVMSSLLQLPLIAEAHGSDAPIGIVTADSRTLTEEFIREIFPSIANPLLIAGLEQAPAFSYTMFGPGDLLDRAALAAEVVVAADELRAAGSRALLFECAALPAYAAEAQHRIRLPIYDFTTLVAHAHAATRRTPFH